MNSIFKKPKIAPIKGRNGFDVSRRRIFSCPCGMLLPTYDDFANPGDHYKLNSRAFIRTEAIETAAFIRLKHHVDWFFVPITQIYRFWNEFFNFTNDVDTSLLPNNTTNFALPKADLYSLFRFEMNSYFATLTQTGSEDGEVNLTVDEFGQPKIFNFRRLYDMFGFGTPDTSYRGFDGNTKFYNNLFKFLAYHRIFYSHYNNSVFFKNRTELYNVDKFYGQDMTSQTALVSEICSRIHYRPFHKDYFTNIQPAPTFNDRFVNSIFPRELIDTTNINKDSVLKDDYITSTSESAYHTPGTFLGFNGSLSELGVGDLRTLFAYDKLMRITANSGSHYDEQTLAHFGFKMPQGISNEAYFLGSQETDININEVVATASTGYDGAGATIGDIAGKGFGASNGSKDIDFTAPCHGIIMGISSIEPIPDYASRGCELQNRYLEPFDFYRPEFDNIGMVPMYNAFFTANFVGAENASMIDGWTYRYSELKTKFDVVNESIWNTYRYKWAGTKQSLYGHPSDSALTPSVSPNLLSLFFCPPQYTNDIFLVDVPTYTFEPGAAVNPNPAKYVSNGTNGTNFGNAFNQANNVYKGDSFLVNLEHKAFKTSIMSVHSLPKFL
ncbi:major capsid protein [Sigmofec virus UA08Rod_4104]|uniref:Major capsid protein n=1 Tax=Sigmofec virus UA08Rod_4104 TaxID=2929394 RepID=A0A976N1N8_9VIRU|nr:major capsid protein [Sigmofec virus UA08Rod_4104]